MIESTPIDSVVSFLMLLVGFGQLGLGLSHVVLPRALSWDTDLAATSPMTRAVSHVHTFFIGFAVTLFGLVDLLYRNELTNDDRLGRFLAGALAVFWACRTGAQVTVFAEETRKLPYGRVLQPVAIAAWSGLSLVHLGAFLLN